MLILLKQNISEENLEELKEVLKGKEIITDPEHLNFFLKHFPGKQINVVSKKVIHKNNINIIFDIDYYVEECKKTTKEFVICGGKSLKFKFQCYSPK